MHRGAENLLDIMPLLFWAFRTKWIEYDLSIVHYLTSKAVATAKAMILLEIWKIHDRLMICRSQLLGYKNNFIWVGNMQPSLVAKVIY